MEKIATDSTNRMTRVNLETGMSIVLPGNFVSLKYSGYELLEAGVTNRLLLVLEVVIALIATDEARNKGH